MREERRPRPAHVLDLGRCYAKGAHRQRHRPPRAQPWPAVQGPGPLPGSSDILIFQKYLMSMDQSICHGIRTPLMGCDSKGVRLVSGIPRLSLGFPGGFLDSWRIPVVSGGFRRIPADSGGFQRILADSSRFWQIQRDSVGFWWILADSGRIHRILSPVRIFLYRTLFRIHPI